MCVCSMYVCMRACMYVYTLYIYIHTYMYIYIYYTCYLHDVFTGI